MKGYESSTYGEMIAEVYDEWHADLDPLPAVEALAELAGSGPVLELAVGTGRVALPLAERGLEVHGIDISEAMVAKLREKPGGDRIAVIMGDFADVAVERAYPLIFVAFNTFFGLLTQAEQVRCFANVAARLRPGGAFALEAFVPDPGLFTRGQRVSVTALGLDRVRIVASRHDTVSQTVESQEILLGGAAVKLHPLRIRYAWPAELDLMAQLAGLDLAERWDGWKRERFTADSRQHVSIYRRS